MAINDFIISTLNVSDDMIFSIDTHKSSDKLHILIKLNDTHPTCPYCGGHTKIKPIFAHVCWVKFKNRLILLKFSFISTLK